MATAPLVDVGTAARILRRGGLVAFPTETVYGLGADASNDAAVARLFAAKGRPTTHPLIVHLAATDQLDAWATDVPPAARRLGDILWPGPLTLLLRRGERARDSVTGGLSTVGVRVPGHPVALELLRAFGGGIAAPSANRFGSISPTRVEHALEELGGVIDGALDGGQSEIGVESTIVDASGDGLRLVRPGGYSRELLEDVLGAEIPLAGADGPAAPGVLASHYAPRALVVAIAASDVGRIGDVVAAHPTERIALLAPATLTAPTASNLVRVDVPVDLETRARTLYESLRAIDERAFDRAIVVLPESTLGLGLAIADRLRKAAGPRG